VSSFISRSYYVTIFTNAVLRLDNRCYLVKLIQGFKENRYIGIAAIKSAEYHLTSTEMVLFELLRTAADPKFKEIFKIVK
jgi:hypothetical protein